MLTLNLLSFLLSVVTVAVALTCHNEQYNIVGLGDIESNIVECGEEEKWCAYMIGSQKNKGKSENFLFRGCANSTHEWKNYYAICSGESKQTIIHGETTGTLYCCDTNNCNPASFVVPSSLLLVLSFCLSFFILKHVKQ